MADEITRNLVETLLGGNHMVIALQFLLQFLADIDILTDLKARLPC